MLYLGLYWREQLRVAPVIELTDEQASELTRLARSKRTSVRLAQRAQIVLLAAQGLQNTDIAEQLGVGRVQVARWRERYLDSGLQGIEQDLPRGAPPLKVDVAKLVELTTQTTPEAATHWSTRKMAAVLKVSPSTVMRHWQTNGLKPHLVRGFKVSRDPKFAEKLEDIVGLYMSPPEHALVLCCDEKSQVQALDRTQPGLPLKKGRAQTMTHDYKRHGTTTLFAALNVLDGQVIGQCQQRHTHVAEVPAPDKPRNAQRQDAALDCRQLRNPQTPGSAGMAGQAPAIPHALHADLCVLAQHGRALLPRHYRQSTAQRRVHQRARVSHCH
jgi:transposase